MTQRILSGSRHETVLAERGGLFSVYCGCRWKALDMSASDAELVATAHTSAEVGVGNPPLESGQRVAMVTKYGELVKVGILRCGDPISTIDVDGTPVISWSYPMPGGWDLLVLMQPIRKRRAQ